MANSLGCIQCGGLARSRGLCQKCYQNVIREVKSGLHTWEELLAARRILPVVSSKFNRFPKYLRNNT